MRKLRIFLITLLCNSFLLPLYGLASKASIEDILNFMITGMREMFLPTAYAVAIYYILKKISARKVVVGICGLILVLLATQILFSFVITSGKNTWGHFAGFWGFYFPWTMLAGLMIPLLDVFYSRRKEKTAQ